MPTNLDEPRSATRNQNPQSPPLSTARALWYSLASFGCGTFFAMNNAAIALYLEPYTKSIVLQGLMASSHSVEGAVIQPIVGVLSDRTRSPIGRRRPFMLLFMPLAALLMALTPVAALAPPNVRLAGIIGCMFLFTVFFNIAYDPYQALMPDITPDAQRGRVTAIWSLIGVAGQAGILLLPIPIVAKFYVVAACLLVTVALTCWKTPESDATSTSIPARHPYAEVREAVKGLHTLRQAARGLAVFFISGTGIGAVLPFLTKFVKHITSCDDQQAQNMFFVLMISTAVAVIPMGKLTDLIGAKAVLMGSLVLIGVASIGGLWASTIAQIAPVLAVAGIGNAAQSAAAYPLLTEIVPMEEVGFYTGLQTMALSVLQPAGVVLSAIMLQQGHYRFVFWLLAGTMFIAMAVLVSLDRTKAPAEIERRQLESGRLNSEQLA